MAANAIPTPAELRDRCILASIVHAVMNARFPQLSHEQAWDGSNYNVQDSEGSRGTVSFQGDDAFCAAFFLDTSERNPFRSGTEAQPTERLLGAPHRIVQLAQTETFQYLLQDWKGQPRPIVTAAFWGVGGDSGAAEPWPQVIQHGASLIQRQCLPIRAAWDDWKRAYEMSDPELSLAKELFDRRRKVSGPVKLTSSEEAELANFAAEGDGLAECLESLAEVQIVKA